MYSDLIDAFVNRNIALTYTSQEELYQLSDFMYANFGRDFNDRQYITFAYNTEEEIERWPFVMVSGNERHLTQSAEYLDGRMIMSVQDFLERHLTPEEEFDTSSIL